MERDPARPMAQSIEARLTQKVRDLEGRIDAMARAQSLVTVGSGAPGVAVTTRFYIDEANHRLYWREAGGWRSVAGS